MPGATLSGDCAGARPEEGTIVAGMNLGFATVESGFCRAKNTHDPGALVRRRRR
jgi:hypothetical protein